MGTKRGAVGRYGVTQWFADGQRAGIVRNPRVTLAVVVPVVLAIATAVLTLSGQKAKPAAGKPLLAGAVALQRQHKQPLPMPTASPPAGADCGIVVPKDPLTAQGLARPYRLTGHGCTMTDTGLQAFVQATILDPATGKLSVYEPLVVDEGTTPAVAPVRPALPAHAVVTIDFGFNGDNLTQVSSHHSLADGHCVNGAAGSIFGQVSYCNGPAFYTATKKAIKAGKLNIPALGTGADGQACPTTRSYTLVDQDQSDNVTTRYLLTADGRTAQDNAANAAKLPGATIITNGSDDALLDSFVAPALGCTPFSAPDLSKPGTAGTSQALNELQASAGQRAPKALVPVNDPMTEVDGSFDIAKTNLYRAGVGQPPLAQGTDPARDAQNYCWHLMRLQVASLQRNQARFTTQPPADPAVGDNLFTFLAARLSGSYDNLGCDKSGLANPVHLTLDGNGVAVAATFGTVTPPSPPPPSSPSPPVTPTVSPAAPGVAPSPATSRPQAPPPATASPSRS